MVEGSIAHPVPERLLEDTYQDTPDHRLACSGITLRSRHGDEGSWELAFPPDGATAATLPSATFWFPDDGGTVPTEAASLLTGWVRTAMLVPSARLHTRRRAVEVLDGQGAVMATVVDDEVSVLAGEGVTLRLRQVAAHADRAPGTPVDVLEQVVGRLEDSGAGPREAAPAARLALGLATRPPPEVEAPSTGRGASVSEVLAAGLAASVLRLRDHDPGVRVGADPEAVHQARVGTRRLRSDLRTCQEVLDPEWTRSLRNELRWLAERLGEVRDADVMQARLRRRVTDLPAGDAEAGAWLVARGEEERAGARRRLVEVLTTERYAVLLDRLVAAARSPQVVGDPDAPAAVVLPALVKSTWQQVRRRVGALPDGGSADQLHEIRKRAKRCRYAAELAAAAVGKPAKRFAGGMADVQDELGGLQDASVTEAWLRRVAQSAPPEVALVAGQLLAAERAEAQSWRSRWWKTWKKASRPKRRAWLKP